MIGDINPWIIATLILSLISPVFYTKSMLKGNAKPHRVTRFVILLAAIAGILGVVGTSNLSGLIFAGIFLARASYLFGMSLIFGVGGASLLDKICLAIATLAVLIYFVSGSGLWAILFGILADLVGYIPTFVKTWRHPRSEDPMFFGIEAIAAFTAIAAISEARVDILFPIYFVLSAGTVVTLIYRKELMKILLLK